jgi:RNA polymerase sigma factor (sigma-70 family)
VAAQVHVPTSSTLISGSQFHATSDLMLVAAAKRGEAGALDFLYQQSSPKILRVLYRITKNREDAEDALQDSLLRALLHLKDFDGRSSFSTWLTRIAINSALMNRRKDRRAREVSLDEMDDSGKEWLHHQIADESPNPEQHCVALERQQLVSRAVGRLRPRVRAVVEFRQLKEFSMRETAKKLGISVAAAKGRLFHARAALRKSSGLKSLGMGRNRRAA